MMGEVEACEFAFERFIKNNEAFLMLNESGYPELGYEMMMLQLCGFLLLLEPSLRVEFLDDIRKLSNKLSTEIFEDECDFLDCVGQTMDAIRET